MYLEDPRPAPDRPGKEPLAPLPQPLPQPPTPQMQRRLAIAFRAHLQHLTDSPCHGSRTTGLVTADSIQSKWSLTQSLKERRRVGPARV